MSVAVESSLSWSPLRSAPDRNTFSPPWGLSGPHHQTLLGAWLRERPRLSFERIWLPSSHGDQIAIDCFGGRPSSAEVPGVVVVPGIVGVAHAAPVRTLAAMIARDLGWPVAGINLRGALGPPEIPRLYHGGSSDDLEAVVPALARLWNRPLVVVGFSLGANIVLKWMGERGSELDASVLGGCAVACPYELGDCAAQLERTWMSRNYRWHLVRQLKERANRILTAFPGQLDAAAVARARTIAELDAVVTAPLHGFPDLATYYHTSSSRRVVGGIARPTLLLGALDDPFVPACSHPTARELDARYVTSELTRNGGHLGYVGRGLELWLERRVVDFCRELTRRG